MTYTVFRLNRSQYQSEEFITHERKAFESIPNIKYTTSVKEIDANDKIIIITTSNSDVHKIPQIILDKTVLLIHPNSGWDNIELDFIAKNKFPMIIGNKIRAYPVSEYIISCVFDHYTKLRQDHYWDQERQWNRSLIHNQKILVIGYGHIGEIIFNTFKNICPNTFVVDPYKFSENAKNKLNHLPKGFLSDVDVVLVCCHLHKETFHLINEYFFNELKKPFLLVNAARGKIVKQEALVHVLNKFPECKAYLDVFEKEPFNPGDFLNIKNLNKTSHIAGVHHLLNRDIIRFEKDVVQDFIHATNVSTIENFLEKYKINNINIRS